MTTIYEVSRTAAAFFITRRAQFSDFRVFHDLLINPTNLYMFFWKLTGNNITIHEKSGSSHFVATNYKDLVPFSF